jgi:FKBP-type peptidyl-prolyl cis-trans isomerase FkpA
MSYRIELKALVLVGLITMAASCNNEPESNMPTQQQVNRSMEDINREFARDERQMIESYIEQHGLEMASTGTGLRYFIYEEGQGEMALNGQTASVNYKVSLLNGDEVYSSAENGVKEFLIGRDNVETGIHEGILHMNVGSKGIFILPSHLAHGLSGDNDRIPPRSSVVYDIELLSLK